jgi:hypothetical protein
MIWSGWNRGLGAKKFKLVWVLEHHKDVDEFIL